MAQEPNYKKALEKIAARVATDESGGWTDQSGILESVGYICESVGIEVPHDPDGY